MLPFGVLASPYKFQKTMKTLLQDLRGVCMYLEEYLSDQREWLDQSVSSSLAETGFGRYERTMKTLLQGLLGVCLYLKEYLNDQRE